MKRRVNLYKSMHVRTKNVTNSTHNGRHWRVRTKCTHKGRTMDAQRERSSERPAVRTMCVILVRTFDEQGQCSSNVRTKLDMASTGKRL
jgi:hypothetical protein